MGEIIKILSKNQKSQKSAKSKNQNCQKQVKFARQIFIFLRPK